MLTKIILKKLHILPTWLIKINVITIFFFVCDAKMKLHIYFIVKKQQLFKSKLVSVGHSLSTLININT